MCELNRQSFACECFNIEKVVKKADFIAIDAEFTGLKLHDGIKLSLFDSGADRYNKLKLGVTQFTAVQIGLSAFVRDDSANKYIAYTYNAHLYPSTFGPIDTRFLSQASSLEFLCRHKFDFNKLLYEGISYMNQDQEKILQSYLEQDHDSDCGTSDFLCQAEIQNKCSLVAEWLAQNCLKTLVIYGDNDEDDIYNYIIQKAIRKRFPAVWTTSSEFGDIVVEKVSEEKRNKLEQESRHTEKIRKEKLLNDMLGFTIVFRMLVKYKKPLLGHNMFLDLLYIYDKFYKPLPDDYITYKRDVHQLFPVILDTKHLAYTLRQFMQANDLVETTNLDCLFAMFDSPKGRHIILNSPDIESPANHDKYVKTRKQHEAGCDAFQCGCVFLRLAHIAKYKDSHWSQMETEGLLFARTQSLHPDYQISDIQPCRFREYLHDLKVHHNCINIARASIPFIRFGEADPVPERPDYLYILSKSQSPLSVSELASLFSPFGAVDIKMQGSHKAIVATTNFRTFRDILCNFRGNNTLHVVRYKWWKHSSVVRLTVGVGVLLCASVCTWALVSKSAK